MDLFELSSQSLQDLMLFLFPGFLFMFLFFYQIPDRKKSELVTIVVSVIASTLFSALARWLFSLFAVLLHVSVEPTMSYTFWISILLALLFSLLLARFMQSENRLFKTIHHELFRVDYYPFGTIWNAYLKMQPDSYVKVTLENGRSYVGTPGRVSNDTNDVH